MRAQAILLAIPSLAMTVVGLALFGPGAVRPFDGAQIWGGPTEGERRLTWRVAVVERLHGIDSTRDIGSILVRARTAGGATAEARCQTRPDGTCDVALRFETEVRGAIHAIVVRATGDVPLAEGELGRDKTGWASAPGHPARLTGQSQGDLRLELHARRGVFAAPFRDELVVTVRRRKTEMAGAEVAGAEVRGAESGGAGVRDTEPAIGGAQVTLRTDAADLDSATPGAESATSSTSASGEAVFGITPRMHAVDVTIEASAAGQSGTWNGLLPVVPGALWLDPDRVREGNLRVVSPVPRDVAYAMLATRSARLWSDAVPLRADQSGFSMGEIAWPDIAASIAEPLWLTLASDPRATGLGTVGWPVAQGGARRSVANGGDAREPRDERPFRDWLLLDGMPAAERRDLARRHRARALSGAALGSAAIVEGFLLARGSLGKGMRSFAAVAIAIATVVLAFAAIAVVVIWKTG